MCALGIPVSSLAGLHGDGLVLCKVSRRRSLCKRLVFATQQLCPFQNSDPQFPAASNHPKSSFHLFNSSKLLSYQGPTFQNLRSGHCLWADWSDYRVSLVCFPSLSDHSSALPAVQRLKQLFSYILSSWLVVYSGSLSVALVTPVMAECGKALSFASSIFIIIH